MWQAGPRNHCGSPQYHWKFSFPDADNKDESKNLSFPFVDNLRGGPDQTKNWLASNGGFAQSPAAVNKHWRIRMPDA
jgi:phage pi2 protein 07